MVNFFDNDFNDLISSNIIIKFYNWRLCIWWFKLYKKIIITKANWKIVVVDINENGLTELTIDLNDSTNSNLLIYYLSCKSFK